MQYTIDNGTLRVSVDTFGAQIKSVKRCGKERAWQNENGAWKDTAPLLFPICGHFGVTVDGKTYPMPAHGFAKKAEFSLVQQTKDSLTFAFSSDERMKKVYPFDFTFEVTYLIDGATLTVTYVTENTGEKPLWYACGGHDSFALEMNVDGYALEFEQEENLIHYAHDDNGYLTGETQNYGENTKRLPLPADYLSEGRTLIFKGISSRKLRLVKKDGAPLVTLGFDGFENLLVWRATADSKYVCIEPWTNLPDPVGGGETELSQKAGVYKIDAHAKHTLVRTIEYHG